MAKRYVTIWFPSLRTDWVTLRNPALAEQPLVLAAPDHGRMRITAANGLAQASGVVTGMVLADARAIFSSLQVINDKTGLGEKLLKALALWCIRFTPVAAVDLADGIVLDVTGCAHLWGGEESYLKEISARLSQLGYHHRLSMADTIGAARAMSHHGPTISIVGPGRQWDALLPLPPESLQIPPDVSLRLHKLGLSRIRNFITMPRASLLRRFGQDFLNRLEQAIGNLEETIDPVIPPEPYLERLPCLEPIVTITGIEMALHQLLEKLCSRLEQEQKGLRQASFRGYRLDGKTEQIDIGTNRASANRNHLFKLFELKLASIEPALGIELFTLGASNVEEVFPVQEKLWEGSGGLHAANLSELIDRLANKIGSGRIHRYFPDEHYWPERSFKKISSITEKLSAAWRMDKPRPLELLTIPQPVEVTAPIPDYPPMLFRYKGNLHKIVKADGPERIEREWWIEQGEHRDYYVVEDEKGRRYWLFRSGHYTVDQRHQWFLHGFFP